MCIRDSIDIEAEAAKAEAARLAAQAEEAAGADAPDGSADDGESGEAVSYTHLMSSEEQLADNLAAMSPFQPLTKSEQNALTRAVRIDKRAQRIPCTGCRYCMRCV